MPNSLTIPTPEICARCHQENHNITKEIPLSSLVPSPTLQIRCNDTEDDKWANKQKAMIHFKV